MKRITSLTILAAGLMFGSTLPAHAHGYGHHQHAPRAHFDGYYGYRYVRSHEMPRWLRRKPAFRHWYWNTRYKRNRSLSWPRLYDIFLWERRHGRYYGRRHDGHYDRHGGNYRDHYDRPRRDRGNDSRRRQHGNH
ncbi:MAG: hypothetical protein QNJ00_04260 [Woeseiaceae bacterium]|nr:hypothetical protein [Woeseiaceae bacterium]